MEGRERKRESKISCEEGWIRGGGLANALECDDDMSNAGHRVGCLSVDSEVLVFPEDIGFVWLRCWVEERGVYLGVECGVDDSAHRTPWLWSVGHDCMKVQRQESRKGPVEVRLKGAAFPLRLLSSSAFIRAIMSATGNGLRSKQEIQSLFDVLRSQLDSHQDTREKLIKVNTQLPLNQNLTHRRFPFHTHTHSLSLLRLVEMSRISPKSSSSSFTVS